MSREQHDRAVSNVSDTANWVAALRATESEREDAVFKDPLASRLAGAKGRAIVACAPDYIRNGWPVVARTKAIDDLVMTCIREGCDCVINLAAGLDTRPYRLELPAALTWIEADLPAIIEPKEALLANERPHCELIRVRVDLSDAEARGRFLDQSLAGRRKVLLLSEGLLMYLEEDVVRSLACDLARPGVTWWMFDIMSLLTLQDVMRSMRGELSNSPMVFAPPGGVGYFEALGWSVLEVRSLVIEAWRLRRLPWPLHVMVTLFGAASDPRQVENERWSGVVLLGAGRDFG